MYVTLNCVLLIMNYALCIKNYALCIIIMNQEL